MPRPRLPRRSTPANGPSARPAIALRSVVDGLSTVDRILVALGVVALLAALVPLVAVTVGTDAVPEAAAGAGGTPVAGGSALGSGSSTTGAAGTALGAPAGTAVAGGTGSAGSSAPGARPLAGGAGGAGGGGGGSTGLPATGGGSGVPAPGLGSPDVDAPDVDAPDVDAPDVDEPGVPGAPGLPGAPALPGGDVSLAPVADAIPSLPSLPTDQLPQPVVDAAGDLSPAVFPACSVLGLPGALAGLGLGLGGGLVPLPVGGTADLGGKVLSVQAPLFQLCLLGGAPPPAPTCPGDAEVVGGLPPEAQVVPVPPPVGTAAQLGDAAAGGAVSGALGCSGP